MPSLQIVALWLPSVAIQWMPRQSIIALLRNFQALLEDIN